MCYGAKSLKTEILCHIFYPKILKQLTESTKIPAKEKADILIYLNRDIYTEAESCKSFSCPSANKAHVHQQNRYLLNDATSELLVWKVASACWDCDQLMI